MRSVVVDDVVGGCRVVVVVVVGVIGVVCGGPASTYAMLAVSGRMRDVYLCADCSSSSASSVYVCALHHMVQ